MTASDYGAVADAPFRNQNNTHLINLQASYDFGPATLSFVGAHQYTKLRFARDSDPGNAVPNYADMSTSIIPNKVDTAELRLTSNNDEGFGWGIGAFYTKRTGTTVVPRKLMRWALSALVTRLTWIFSAGVGINAALNAAYLAIQIVALTDPALAQRYAAFRKDQSDRIDTFE